jgi:2-amino-4-hydroxy-6-hydroxymethyldihydropteridine diphosphokinase
MILISLGSNVTGPWGPPRSTIEKALRYLNSHGCRLIKASSLFETTPFGKTDQRDFINAVARVETELTPEALLERLHHLETLAGRIRGERWGPRQLDLDIIDYHGTVRERPPPVLPHPGVPLRPFVLAPIAEIAPRWRHPILRKTAGQLLEQLKGQSEGAIIGR